MAKPIYDYWFVQFDFPYDFVHGKPDSAGKPYKSSGGKMVWSEELKREIPEGWEVKKLIELSNQIGDGLHGTPQYIENSEYNFINGNNLKDGFIQIDDSTNKVTLAEYEKYYIDLNRNSILLSINGTLGNLAIYTNEKVLLGKSSAYINSKENHRAFCYLYLKQEQIQKSFWNIATGSTIKNLSLASLKNLKLGYPGIEIIKSFDKLIKPMDDKRENIFKENLHLSSLRDWLLPMLMNGQVKVETGYAGEVESMMAAEPGERCEKLKTTKKLI
jgi:type I restriction enzyme S subunit